MPPPAFCVLPGHVAPAEASSDRSAGRSQRTARQAMGVFGSGWAWLVYDKATRSLELASTPNQDTPAMQASKIPLMVTPSPLAV